MTEIVITNSEERFKAAEMVANLNLEKPWVVTVKKKVKARSQSQHRLMWLWIDKVAEAVADDTGNDVGDIHDFFKRKFLTPKLVSVGDEETFRYTTKSLSVKEMSVYLDRIQAWTATTLGISLPIPDDLRFGNDPCRTVKNYVTDPRG